MTAKKEAHQKDRLHEAFQEEIANTYFRTSTASTKASEKAKPSLIPWIVAVAAMCIAVVLFVSKSNFDVKVRVVSGAPFITRDGSPASADDSLSILQGGEANNGLVARAYFLGDGRNASKLSADEAVLCNSKGQGWASFVVEFKKPVDLKKFDIRYTAKGKAGIEKIVPVITDTDNRSYRVDDASVTTLAGSWQTYIINFNPVKSNIDLAAVSAIKFEFGTETAGNSPEATMSIKDISMIKTRKVKWL